MVYSVQNWPLSIACFGVVLLAVFSTVISALVVSVASDHMEAIKVSAVGMLGRIPTIVLAVYISDAPFILMIVLCALLVMAGVTSMQFKS
jgi:hypothetical protein